jgi:multicomponent Na+:H+ antiporter subunit D
VGVYALIRTFCLVFVHEGTAMQSLLVWCGGLTMVTGVLGAAAQNRVRRILSFHIISQIGYMVLGLGLYSPLAVAGAVFYILHHIIVKSNLFLLGGVIETLQGSDRLKTAGGILKSRPVVAAMFAVPALSLAGIPPLSGFFAKLAVIRASLELDRPLVAAVALAVGALTLFSMTKIWNAVFWKAAPAEAGIRPARIGYRLVPVFLLCAITISIGLFGDPLFELTKRAAAQLIDTSGYIAAVLGTNSSDGGGI